MKNLLKTKSFWTGIAGVAGGVALIVTGNTAEGVAAIMIAIQSINLRSAISKK